MQSSITTSGERAERATIEIKGLIEELLRRLDKVESDIVRLRKDIKGIQNESITFTF